MPSLPIDLSAQSDSYFYLFLIFLNGSLGQEQDPALSVLDHGQYDSFGMHNAWQFQLHHQALI